MSPPNRRRGGARRGVCFRLPKRGPGRRYDVRLGVNHENGGHGAARPHSPVARRPGAAVERDMSMVCGRASAPGAAHPIARNATRRSKRSVLFAFLVVIPVSRYSIPRRGPAAIDGSKIRRTFDRALCLVVSAVDEGRMRWTRDSRRRTDNRPAIVGIGKRSPSPRGAGAAAGRPRPPVGVLSLEEAELPEGYAPYASQGTPLNSYIHTRTVL